MPLRGQIPAIRIGRVWRFDRDAIDDWIRTGQNEPETDARPEKKAARKKPEKKKSRKSRFLSVLKIRNQKKLQ